MTSLAHNIKTFASVTAFPIGRVHGVQQVALISNAPGRVGIFWQNRREDSVETQMIAPYGIRSIEIVNQGAGWQDTEFVLELKERDGTVFSLTARGDNVGASIAARMRPFRARGLFAAVAAIVSQSFDEIRRRQPERAAEVSA